MNKIFLILFLSHTISCLAQNYNDIQILNLLLAPAIDINEDFIYDENGKVNEIYKSLFDDLVIVNYTSDISKKIANHADLLKNELSNLQQSTYQDFKNQNRKSSKIDSLNIRNRKIIFIERPEAKEIIEKKNWSKFEINYPNAKLIISISKIGYNKDKTQALLYSTNNNYLGGNYGFYTLFKLYEEKWIIDQSTIVSL